MTTTIGNQTLTQGDFLRLWQQVPDNSIDLVLTDPPYGIITRGHPWDLRPNYHVLAWLFEQLLSPIAQVVMFCDFANAFAIHNAFKDQFDYQFNWVWQKPCALPINKTQPANEIEYILVYKRKQAKTGDITFNLDELRTPGSPYKRPGGKNQNKNPIRGNGGNLPDIFENESGDRFPRTILPFPNKPCMKKGERTSHPTQKPVAMLEYIINGLSDSGNTILDPFVGSGSTLVACQSTDRRGIGFELQGEYYKMAKERLDNQTAQGVLM